MGVWAQVGRRVLEAAEEWSGRELIATDERRLLESDRSEARLLRKTLEWARFTLFNQPGSTVMSGGTEGFDAKLSTRVGLGKQALDAWIMDPQAGLHGDLYVSFVLGRGVPNTAAADPEVQAVIDENWADPANRRVLTSYERLVEKLLDLCIQCNVFFTFADDGDDGMVRVGLLPFELVDDAIRHDELARPGLGDRFRILYYRVIDRQVSYSFQDGTRTLLTKSATGGGPRYVYYEAHGAFDPEDSVMRAQDVGLKEPPAAMLQRGRVYHLAVNKTSEMAFGVPRLRRQLRWLSAYNDTLESHVKRMKAMAAIYMKATAQGSERDLSRLGQMLTSRASAFDVAHEGDMPAPVGPGVIGQNESLNFEPFKIDSGATDVQASMPLIRGQVNGPWPDHYTAGTAGELAGATAMELPVLKFVEREQETVLGLFRAFNDACIQAAIRVGKLTEWRDATVAELEQMEVAKEAGEPPPFEMQGGRVKRDLSYDISLPNPLKRAMGDIVSAAVETAAAVDPTGEYPEMSRWLFGFILAEAFDVENPQRIVDQVLPRHQPEPEPELVDPATGLPMDTSAIEPGAKGADGKQHTEDNAYGAKRNSPQAEEQAKKVAEAAAGLHPLPAAVDDLLDAWGAGVLDLEGALSGPPASQNGHRRPRAAA